MGLVFATLAQRHGVHVNFPAAIAVWLTAAALVTATEWSLIAGILFNAGVMAACLPLAQRFRTAKMPLIARRWYDIPLRAMPAPKQNNALAEALAALNPDEMSPREALDALYALKLKAVKQN